MGPEVIDSKFARPRMLRLPRVPSAAGTGRGADRKSFWFSTFYLLLSTFQPMPIRILVTGGTFDKEYNENTGQLYFKDTHLTEMLRLGRSRVDVFIRTVMMVDSLQMTDADRQLIVQNCLQSDQKRIVITHGTDTMS